ncbi:hypothetical protein FHS29_004211 [Saccharothrix tamanrassetensis]|uniref:DUF3558 domain-containing protein n=1 Tax=Saccharothrix tamanrassetensis TaxID=1051531 RepID=A0A841CQ40_9PSEU|nr:DUF3558 domain-containing protein [Saccharothrix tamanrassetensis]MBB5957616.1 hypothetical protein [Saccharothrix tamanrassetensis]
MNRTFRTILVAGVFSVTLASCTSPEGGNPTAAPTTGTSATATTSSSASSGGPDLDIGKFVAAPCAILTPEQIAAVSTIREAKAAESETGPGCTYQGKDVLENSTFKVVFSTKGKPFDELMAEGKAKFPIFDKKEIAGIPAAVFDSTDGSKSCNAVMRASDKTSVLVQGTIAKNDKLNPGKPCSTVEQVATTVAGTLKG